MPWYMILLLICAIIGPFDALYMYIRAERRKEALKRKKEGLTGDEGDRRE